MRLLMLLLLLSVWIHHAQGRWSTSKGSLPADDGLHSLHEEVHDEEVIKSTIDESKSKKTGSIRKLTVIKSGALSSTNSKIESKEENLSAVKSSSKTQQAQDILDMAEMDYTLAKRKPPIHN